MEKAHSSSENALAVCNEPENAAAMKRRMDAVDLRFNELSELASKEVDGTEKAVDNAKGYKAKMDDVTSRIDALQELMNKPFEVGSNVDKVKEGLIEVEVGISLHFYASSPLSQYSSVSALCYLPSV